MRRPVQRGQILMTVVEPQGDWELELKMPEEDMGFVSEAQAELGDELPVNYVVATSPGVTLQGTVKEVHRSAEVRGEEGNTVLVRVAINKEDVQGTARRRGREGPGALRAGLDRLRLVPRSDCVCANENLIPVFLRSPRTTRSKS